MGPEPSSSSIPAAQQNLKMVHIAPAGDMTIDMPDQQPVEPHMPYTCVTCAKRKVKCDKTGPPCGTCRKARQECSYQEPPPRKRKRKPVEDLQERLHKYERLLRDNNIFPKEDLLSPTRPTSSDDKSSAKLIKAAGKSRYVDSTIWHTLGDDIHPSSDEEDVDYYRSYQHGLAMESQKNTSMKPETNTPAVIDPVSAAFISPASAVQDLPDVHPTYDLAVKLWKQYTLNVDPVIRLLHLPTTFEMLQRAAINPSEMTKVQECLLFSVYHFAVVATAEAECESLFGRPLPVLRKQYHDATRQALVACQFLRTTELAVLQGLILFLLASRDQYDPHTFWIMTGIAVRISQRMGLHRDGEELGLKPFDIQMRRRVFWQLLPLDGLSGQLSGTGIAISADSWDTKQPINISDEDIWPGMEVMPEEKKGATDMTFCLARTEIGKFHQKLRPVFRKCTGLLEPKDDPFIHTALQELENCMEEQYIRYCDIANPIHCLTIAMARAAINTARLRIQLPAAKAKAATREQRKEMVDMSLKILDYVAAVHLNVVFVRYAWHVRQFFQWDAVIWVLNEVCRVDSVIDAQLAWEKMDSLYECHPEFLAQKRSLDVALNRLVVRSWDVTTKNRGTTMAEPAFIGNVRRLLGRKEARQTSGGGDDQANQAQNGGSEDTVAWNSLDWNPLLPGGMFEDMNADVDWRFWEQLMQDPDAYPGMMN